MQPFEFACIVFLFIWMASMKCDWIQIPQISNKPPKYFKEEFITSHVLTTTPRDDLISTQIEGDILSEVKEPILNNVTETPTTELFLNSTGSANSQSTETEEIDLEIQNSDETTEDMDEYEETEQNNTYQNASFGPYLNSVQNVLLKNPHKKIKSKIKVLQDLQDNLLFDIENRIRNLFSEPNREARHYKEDDHHQMDFPSNEGALMTIGFLTFAVFLIKLVLKLIHVLKKKENESNMSMMAMMGMSDTTMASYIGRRKRSIYEQEAEIMNFIEEYKVN